jgi:adenosylcobinamide kinase / adenosylcobinamide-phosphate guanylyltransferase
MSLTLITGGVRSGKSAFAAALANKVSETVLFVATATSGDAEMTERIKRHRAERPLTWTTLEVNRELTAALAKSACGFPVIIIECLTLLLNNICGGYTDGNGEITDGSGLTKECDREMETLLGYIRKSNAQFIVVTNEVGSGIVPVGALSRIYRDILGKMNQMVAGQADAVYLMVAGIPLRVK